MWFFGFNEGIKTFSQYVEKNSLRPNDGAIDINGVAHYEFSHQRYIVNHWHYLELMKRQESKVRIMENQILVPPSWQCANSRIAID